MMIRRLRFRVTALLLATFALFMADIARSASTEKGLSPSELISSLRTLLNQTKTVREAIGKLRLQVHAALPESMVRVKDLEAIEASTRALRQLDAAAPPRIFTKEQIRRIAIGGNRPGTPIGSQEEKRRLRAARDQRKVEIENLKTRRQELNKLVTEYKEQIDRTQEVADYVGKNLLTPEIEFMTSVRGTSMALSWGDFETAIIPALADRLSAAEDARRRLDRVIAATEDDLRGFSEGLAFAEYLFPENGLTPPASLKIVDPNAAPGSAGLRIREIEYKMATANEAAIVQAGQLRSEAKDIRTRNAQIDRLTGLLTVAGNAATLAGAGKSADKSQGNDVKPHAVHPATKIYIKIEQNGWVIQPPPATGTQQKETLRNLAH